MIKRWEYDKITYNIRVMHAEHTTIKRGEQNLESIRRGFVIHNLNDWNDLPVMERWFHREHAADVMLKTPWLVKYDMYRAVNPPPEGAENYCFMNYRVHETLMHYPGADDMNGKPSLRPEPIEDAMNVAMFYVSPAPENDFWGKQRRPFETSVIRWITVFQYPDGVDKVEADNWYTKIHAPEIIQKAGNQIIRYFSYRVLPKKQWVESDRDEQNQHIPFHKPSPFMGIRWDRMTEMWFETGRDWTSFIKHTAPTLSKPAWASNDIYPFVIPGKEFCSTFLLERPTEDLLRTTEKIYYA